MEAAQVADAVARTIGVEVVEVDEAVPVIVDPIVAFCDGAALGPIVGVATATATATATVVVQVDRAVLVVVDAVAAEQVQEFRFDRLFDRTMDG